jgi:hypothetical protein
VLKKKPFVPEGKPYRTRILSLGQTLLPGAAHLLAQRGYSNSVPFSRSKQFIHDFWKPGHYKAKHRTVLEIIVFRIKNINPKIYSVAAMYCIGLIYLLPSQMALMAASSM